MPFVMKHAWNRVSLLASSYLIFSMGGSAVLSATQAQSAQPRPAQSSAAARPVGTIKSISGNTITLTTDAGGDVTVLVQEAAKLVRIAPGQKDLKDATSIQLQDLQPNDRVLVRGELAEDGKSVLAISIIAMKRADVAQKQSHEREEWQKYGAGGLVSSVDAASSTIVVTLPAIGEKKTVTIHLSKDTIVRRYAPDSVKFDDARPAPLDRIKPGDQLRARGSRSADGNDLAADEIVSGTFRSIAGTISAIDASAGTVTVQDLVTKESATIKITSESQLRKLPPPMAQRIAMRLKGIPADAPPQGAPAVSAGGNSPQVSKPGGPPTGGVPASGFGGSSRPGGSGPGDLQQAINRMPPATLADFQKGDAVMLVATEGGPNGLPFVITLLGGVEPILEASPTSGASTILSPWSLGGGPSAEGAIP